MNYDNKAREDYKLSKASIYFWILASSYLYYHEPDRTPLLSDECFDKMCSYLLSNLSIIKPHSLLHHLVTDSHLQAGSFYDILDNQYPLWLVRMAQDLSDKLK